MDTAYQVVEFVLSKDVAIVPSSWIFHDTETKTLKTYWPPYKNTDKLNKSVKNKTNPESEWASYSCRLLGGAGILLFLCRHG